MVGSSDGWTGEEVPGLVIDWLAGLGHGCPLVSLGEVSLSSKGEVSKSLSE